MLATQGTVSHYKRVPQGLFGKQVKLQIIWTVFKILHSLVRFPLCPSSGDGAQDLRHGRRVLCHWATPKSSPDQREIFNVRESQLHPPWMGVTLESRRVETLLGWVCEGPQLLLAANLKMEMLAVMNHWEQGWLRLRPDTSSDAWQETDTLEDVRTKSFLMLLSSSWCPAPKCDHLLCKLFNYGRLLGLCKSRWVNPWHFS